MTVSVPASSTDTTPASTLDKNLDQACVDVDGKITRTDSKASLLLAFVGAVLAGCGSAADDQLPLVTKVAGGAAVLALGAAAVLLLLVVRPNLSGADRASFPYWARLDETQILQSMGGDTRLARIRVLSGIAAAKYERLTWGVNIILAALALLAVAAIGALT